MDISKYPLEKLLHYVAGIIPGLTALLVMEMAAPSTLGRLFALGFLGYRTKLIAVLLAAFVIGNTLTVFFGIILGVILVVIGAVIEAVRARPAYQARHAGDPAPWRDLRWRALVKKRLDTPAPDDTMLEPRAAFDLRRKIQEILPEQARSVSLKEMDEQRRKAEINDLRWSEWYHHYHDLVIQKENRTFDSYVRKGLTFNMETAALYVLVSAAFVPAMRHWWYILPACGWVLFVVLETLGNWNQYANKWSTLSAQIKYLSEVDSGEASRTSGPPV